MNILFELKKKNCRHFSKRHYLLNFNKVDILNIGV